MSNVSIKSRPPDNVHVHSNEPNASPSIIQPLEPTVKIIYQAESSGSTKPAIPNNLKPTGSFSAKYLPCSIKSALVMAAVGGVSKIWINWFNKTRIINIENLEASVKDRTPLITISNHTSCADDPLMWGILSWEILVVKPYLMRWTMAAKEICFTNNFTSRFFTLGRCIPTIRGQGVYQNSVDKCLDVLNNNGWVHVFPEGKVNLLKQSMRLKWGVGRLIAETETIPIVIPMWHIGMDDIFPNMKPRLPRIGKTLTVLIGNPISFDNTIDELGKEKLTAAQIRANVTHKLQQTLDLLKVEAESLHQSFTNHDRLL